jgi:hypothetical protein
VVNPFLAVSRLQGSFDQPQEAVVVDVFSKDIHQGVVLDVIEGFDNLLPLSTTHSMTPWKS